jgi:hypothetical protein
LCCMLPPSIDIPLLDCVIFINCIPTYFVHPWIIMVIIILCKWHIVEHIEIVGSNIGTKTYLWNLARKQPWNSSVVSYYQDAWILMYLKYMGMKAIELNYLGISKPSNGYWSRGNIFITILNLFNWNFPSPSKWWMFKPKIEIHEMVSTWCPFQGKDEVQCLFIAMCKCACWWFH